MKVVAIRLFFVVVVVVGLLKSFWDFFYFTGSIFVAVF